MEKKKKSLLPVKTKNHKEALLDSGDSLTSYRRLLLYGGGKVCIANMGGSCLHGGGSWRPRVPPSSLKIYIHNKFNITKF